MNQSKLYYNPRCSKCREALALLNARGIEPHLITYLEQPPSLAELTTLIKQLNFTDARSLMRQGESEYTDLGLNKPELTQDALLDAMIQHPKLIERPIFVHQDRAIIGRPAVLVLDIL